MSKSKTFYYKGRKCLKFMKVCKSCGKLKIIKNFRTQKNGDGYYNKCKKCSYETLNNKYINICEYCGKKYKSRYKSHQRSKHDFCCLECANKYQKENPLKGELSPRYNSVETKCSYCGRKITVRKYKLNAHKYVYCNKECQNKHYKQIFKGENNPMFGTIRPDVTGEKNWNWNPKLTQKEREQKRHLKENDIFRKDVRVRDNYTCQVTGKRGGDLEVHHLNCYSDFPQERFNIDNGITLSKEIHKLFHKVYGNRHNTKEQFEEFKNRFINGEFKEVV